MGVNGNYLIIQEWKGYTIRGHLARISEERKMETTASFSLLLFVLQNFSFSFLFFLLSREIKIDKGLSPEYKLS